MVWNMDSTSLKLHNFNHHGNSKHHNSVLTAFKEMFQLAAGNMTLVVGNRKLSVVSCSKVFLPGHLFLYERGLRRKV